MYVFLGVSFPKYRSSPALLSDLLRMPGSVVPETPLEVAIIGGGIVGMVLANGLVRQNVQVQVFEQAKSFREIGAGIAFTANAQRCMELIHPAIRGAFRSGGSCATSNDSENPNDCLRWIDGYNQRSNQDPNYEKMLFKIDAGYRGFEGCRRDQFLEALVNITPPGVVQLKKRLSAITEVGEAKKLLMTFVDGTTAEADAGMYQFLASRHQLGHN